MNKPVIWSALGIIAIGAAVSFVSVYASQANAQAFGPKHTPERHEEMTKAFETDNYAAWKQIMGDRGATKVITAETFPKFAEMHKLKLEGKTEEADKIRQELGLGNRNGKGTGHSRHGQGAKNNAFVDKNNDGVCDHKQ